MENRNNNKPEGDKNSKFNSYWIYGLLALLLLALNFYTLQSQSAKPLEWSRFEDMIKDGDVKELEVINKERAQVYLTDHAIANEIKDDGKYHDAATSQFASNRANYYFEILNPETFETKLDALQLSLIHISEPTRPY